MDAPHARKVDIGIWGLVLAFAIQFGTVVWFSAKLEARTDNQQEATAAMQMSIKEMATAVRSLERILLQANARVDVLDALLRERTEAGRQSPR